MGLTKCPNLKCRKKIKEPIFLNNFSSIPSEHYYACPHCLTKLNEYARMHTYYAGLFLTAFGSIALALVGYLTWSEMTMSNTIAITGSTVVEAIRQISIGEFTLILFIGVIFFILGYGFLGIRATKRL
jgi:hypothetical protein